MINDMKEKFTLKLEIDEDDALMMFNWIVAADASIFIKEEQRKREILRELYTLISMRNKVQALSKNSHRRMLEKYKIDYSKELKEYEEIEKSYDR